MNNLFLIGFMGCGKSTVASALCRRYHLKQFEMDSEIVRQAGMPISQIFSRYGEEYFRTLETDLLRQLSGTGDLVVSCGGGAAMKEENVRLMRNSGRIILLTARPETILARTAHDHNRPLLEGRRTVADITELMEQRRPRYEAAADITVSTDGKRPDEIADEIIARCQ